MFVCSPAVRVQRLTLGSEQSWTVVAADGLPIPPVEQWLEQLRVANAAPNTVRAYAAGLALWWVFLDVDGLDWRAVGLGDVASFLSWMRYRQPDRSPSEATLSARLAAVVAFYRFHEAFSSVAVAPSVSTKSAGAGEGRAEASWPIWRPAASTVRPLCGFVGIRSWPWPVSGRQKAMASSWLGSAMRRPRSTTPPTASPWRPMSSASFLNL